MLVAVPDGVAHATVNTASGPPASVTARSVRGISGTLLNVVVLVARLTLPLSVSENGGGNTSAIAGAASEPVRYAFPASGVGYRGEVELAVPNVLHVPAVGFAHRIPPFSTAWTFGASTGQGSVSATVRLVDWAGFAGCVICVLIRTPSSPASLAAVTWNDGVNRSAEHAVTCSGALAVGCAVGAAYESAVTVTFAGVAGPLVGSLIPVSVLLSSCTDICVG